MFKLYMVLVYTFLNHIFLKYVIVSHFIYIYIYIYELDITDARACLDPQYLINFKLNTLNAEYT